MNKPRIPRGVRNNNPLNIRYVKKNNWKGRVVRKSDKDFEEFKSMMYGYRAAFILLHRYMNLYNLHTILDIVSRWAPQSDGNDTIAYANTVSQKTGIPIQQEVTFTDWKAMVRIVRAMSEVENGVDMSYVSALQGYIAAAQNFNYVDTAVEAQEHFFELTTEP